MKKIAFFDIDGTLTSERDGSIPVSAIESIRQARANGHLMFLNTGRCFQNVEERFQTIGFDGYVCGCGTNLYCDGNEIFYNPQSEETTKRILAKARATRVDILFEGRKEVSFDLSRPLSHPGAVRQYRAFVERDYDMRSPDAPGFFCDKFVIWYQYPEQLAEFRKESDELFECIDRGGTFREFVPKGFSKATGILQVLKYYGLPLENAYAFGDSNNDLPMLTCVPHSIAMGNASPASLFEKVSYVTQKASADGIRLALSHFQFI